MAASTDSVTTKRRYLSSSLGEPNKYKRSRKSKSGKIQFKRRKLRPRLK